jgi:hypothetical protein
MRALTLHNPWAILMATGDKRFETRSWGTSYRGPFAIHSAKMTSAHREVCMEEPYRSLLAAHGYASPDDLPSGAIVALGLLVNCVRITSEMKPTDEERALGDWTPGRFAWDFRMTVSLRYDPIPTRGYQGLWTPKGLGL